LAIGAGNRRHARNLSIGVARTRGHHTRLTVAHHAAILGRETRSRRIVDGSVDVASWNTGGGGLLHPDLIALGNLALKLLPTYFTTLSKRYIQGFCSNHLVVHFSNSFGSLIWGREANKAEALRSTLFVAHDFAAGDSTEWFELGPKLFIVEVIFQVLDVEIDTLVLGQLLKLGLLVGAAEFLLTLSLLLSTGDKELPTLIFNVVEFVSGFLSFLMPLKINEAESLALALFIGGNESRGNGAIIGEDLGKLFLRDFRIQVLDVEVREMCLHLV
jgi:hypothetical protein